jgi:hypothetical protein
MSIIVIGKYNEALHIELKPSKEDRVKIKDLFNVIRKEKKLEAWEHWPKPKRKHIKRMAVIDVHFAKALTFVEDFLKQIPLRLGKQLNAKNVMHLGKIFTIW